MTKLRETLESLTVLCWNATPEDKKNKVQEYLKSYPHLRNPATVDLLHQAVGVWFRIKMVEERLDNATDPKEQDVLLERITKLQRLWLQMLGNLGISFTRVQYKGKKRVVQPPIERLEMLQKKKGKKT